jgi:lipoprotein signal peptidase
VVTALNPHDDMTAARKVVGHLAVDGVECPERREQIGVVSACWRQFYQRVIERIIRPHEPMLDGMSGHRHRDRAPSAGAARRPGAASRRPHSGNTGQVAGSGRPAWRLLAAVFVLVLGTDQATKWLTWRHFDGTVINEGGYILLGSARSWFAEPVPGAVANLVGIVLIAIGLAVLLRRPRRTAVTLGCGLVAAGWTSNLLDRVGLHEWTAPGSGRGVVDFIPSGGSSRCNIADFWIVLGLIVFGVEMLRRRRERRSPP